ncbi:hypothetical protein P8C59_008326 [Phyllachora maydis]|uniref:Autophagy-related protein 28 n=1 Tax=Phyllachora maydis TaxID=1825666 RepID=A0AAD9IAD8_9PEZI|nr:hypothetical protein P8C59_008326 [Phyllachora maydis]
MASRSFFLPDLFPRSKDDDHPVLPFHASPRRAPRKLSTDYSLSELSPRTEDALLTPDLDRRDHHDHRRHHTPPRPHPSTTASASSTTSASASKHPRAPPPPPRLLFAGPPPPIAASRVLYRDDEASPAPDPPPRGALARSASILHSVLFPAAAAAAASTRRPDTLPHDAAPPAAPAPWRALLRRERALHAELQGLLDAQSVGLAAGTGQALAPPPPPPPPLPSPKPPRSRSRSGGASPTTTQDPCGSGSVHRGGVVPVRQPRPEPLSLRSARAALADALDALADLRAEEDMQLAAALGARRGALARLGRLGAQRAGIEEALGLGGGGKGGGQQDEEAEELRELAAEGEVVRAEVAELEERLAGLRERGRWIARRVGEVKSRQEAGRSGYRGALREVEARLRGLLEAPPVRPLEAEVMAAARAGRGRGRGRGGAGPQQDEEDEDSDGAADGAADGDDAGAEFLRLRPERRTPAMARAWWEREVAILSRRKAAVDAERAALADGAAVWRAVVRLVSEFEAGLYHDLYGSHDNSNGTDAPDDGKPSRSPAPSSKARGKHKAACTPAGALRAQLAKMRPVQAALAAHLATAEARGWNPLVCAVGAELAAFQQGEALLREALRMSAGSDADDRDDDDAAHHGRVGGAGEEEELVVEHVGAGDMEAAPSPASPRRQPGGSGSGSGSGMRTSAFLRPNGARGEKPSPSSGGAPGEGVVAGADEQVLPPALVGRQQHETDGEGPGTGEMGVQAVGPEGRGRSGAAADHEHDSENEVPPEFLAEHHDEEGVE